MQSSRSTWGSSFLAFVALTACAAVLLLVAPTFSGQASEALKRATGKALAVGLASLLLVPMLAGLLFITILRIPLGIAMLMFYPALLLLGYLIGTFYISQRAQLAIRKETSPSFSVTIGFFALALFLLILIAHLPFVGPVILAVTALLGTGACVLELNRHRHSSTPTTPLTSNPTALAKT
jgi:hypothetical protein